ncbi:hypothetical protein BH20ACT22_BH20ACT22_03010 [soil metagenome]
MSIEFLLTSFIVVATPGTGVLYTIAAGFSRGARASLIASVGRTLGIVPHMVAAITGLAALLHTSAMAFQILKYLGLAYLLHKERIARLVKEGRMAKAGLNAMAVAKKNGSWTALDSVEALKIPPDLAEALAGNKKASHHFDGFPSSSRKIILWWIESAKRKETRARRISETVRLAAENIRANHR